MTIRKINRFFVFLLMVVICILNVPKINAQKVRLHAMLRGVETPLKMIRYPGADICYNDERKELVISGVEVITRDMVERYKSETKILIIGTDVHAIDDFAFCDFTNLRYVYQKYHGFHGGLDNHLRLIGIGAFKNCSKLEAICMINRYGVTLLENAFMDCVNLRWVDLNIKSVASQTFVRCSQLKISNISGFDNIFYVSSRAFEDCGFISESGERINDDWEVCGYSPIIESIDFRNGIITLKGKDFSCYDLLPYFLALREHCTDIFYVIVDEDSLLDGVCRVSDDVWDLFGCRFCLFTKAFYNYWHSLHDDACLFDQSCPTEGTSPETDSDFE